MAREILLADADVLIDYVEGDLSIIALVAEHIGPIYVLRQVLQTVDGLTESECRRHRIQVREPNTELLLEAGQKSGSLSFEDWLCFLTCRNEGWTCVTNDGALIRECRGADVPIRRGLSLMVELVRNGALERRKALRVAEAIHKANPLHINERVLARFLAALEEL